MSNHDWHNRSCLTLYKPAMTVRKINLETSKNRFNFLFDYWVIQLCNPCQNKSKLVTDSLKLQ